MAHVSFHGRGDLAVCLAHDESYGLVPSLQLDHHLGKALRGPIFGGGAATRVKENLVAYVRHEVKRPRIQIG
jgi:hypothetical protein